VSICLFCPRRATTNEHVWPKWVIKIIGPDANIETWFGPDAIRKAWRAHGDRRGKFRSHIQVKHLCAPCNNGWLSRLENRAKKIMSPLIEDWSIPLDPDDQHLIALWSIKTAMVFEATHNRENWFYTDSDRQNVLATLSPPGDTVVWLGRFERSNPSTIEARTLHSTRPERNLVVREGYAVTFNLGRAVIQILTVRRERQNQMVRITLDVKRGPWSASLLRVWPAGSIVSWPPPRSFTESGLDDLSRRFTTPP
jgi:hypothetical protein